MTLRPIVSGLEAPVVATNAGDGSGRLFIVEQKGLIRIFKNGSLLSQPFLDLTGQVEAGGEKGLLGLAFHPLFRDNRRFFLNYTTRRSGRLQTVIAEYRASASNPDRADIEERVLVEFDQPYENHNGGQLAFGPDGYLYIGTGDGGSGGDPQGNGQKLGTLLAKILRIDVDTGSPYASPSDNPFVQTTGALLYQMYEGAGQGAGDLVTEAGVDASILGRELIGAASRDTPLGLDSALALVNPSDQPAELKVTVKNLQGAISGEHTVTLGPREHRAQFLSEIVPGIPSRFEGTLLVTASQDVAAVLLRTRGGILSSSLPVSH